MNPQKQNMLSSEYVVVKKTSTADFRNHLLGVSGFEGLDALLKENGYVQQQKQGSLLIYHKSQSD